MTAHHDQGDPGHDRLGRNRLDLGRLVIRSAATIVVILGCAALVGPYLRGAAPATAGTPELAAHELLAGHQLAGGPVTAEAAEAAWATLADLTARAELAPPATVIAENGKTVQTEFGPLTAADRDLLVKVRQAGLWEVPAGDQAKQKSANPVVQDVGSKIMADHIKLDETVREVAKQLGVPLPNEPNADQKRWLAEMAAADNGEEFDKVYANRLRAAHGKVFAVIAAVRASTANSVVRTFANASNTAVLRHMTLLESTGDVNIATLTGDTPSRPAGLGLDQNTILIAVVAVAIINFVIYRRTRRRSLDRI